MGSKTEVNKISSIYDRGKIFEYIQERYDNNAKIYTNEKTEQYIKSAELQLLMEMKYALSTNYNRQSFTKSQIEADIGIEVDCETLWEVYKQKREAFKCYSIDTDGLPIIASLDFDGVGQYYFEKINSNYLTSIYGHENIEGILTKAMDLDFILYVNEKNTTKLGNLSKLPLLRGLPQLGYKGIIHKSSNFINYSKVNTFANEVKEATAKQEAEKMVMGSGRSSREREEI